MVIWSPSEALKRHVSHSVVILEADAYHGISRYINMLVLVTVRVAGYK
jgi:hypothetical protein